MDAQQLDALMKQHTVIHILVYSFAVGSSIYNQLRPESYFF